MKGERYGGWARKDVVGQISGHYMSALSLMYASSGDKRFKQRVDYMVSEIAIAQQKHGDGYTGPVRTEVWEKVYSGDLKAHKWGVGGGYVPWYVMHKTFAGLIDAYIQTDNKQALAVVIKLADWAKKGTDNLDEAQFQDMLRAEHGGMSESFAHLYAITGNKDYLTLAQRFDHEEVLGPLAKKEDKLTGYHVNTQLPKILSAARLYELTGDARYATAVNFLWDRVINTRSMAPGGVDVREHFYEAGSESAHLHWNSSETCSVYNMLKLTRSAFSWNPTATAMDYYERALYNQILGSQDPDSGGMTYYYNLKPGHFKIYSTPFDAMWCCVGSGIENHSKYADTIYAHNDDTLWVNLFIPSLLDWQEKDVRVRMETTFPADETITLTVNTKTSQNLDLKVRVPYWATQGAEVTINGKKQDVKSSPESYLTVSREWKDGDTIAVRLPMNLHLRPARDKKDMVTLMYGPLVLAGELGSKGLPNDVSSNQKAHSGAMDPPVPVFLVDANKEPSSWLKRVPGDTLRFKTVGVGKPNDVTLIPLADLHHQRYTVYWETMDPKDWKPAAPIAPAEIAESSLVPGLSYKYYENEPLKVLPDFSELTAKKTGTVGHFDLSIKSRNDNFGVVFSGYLKIAEKGQYIFATRSDDGSNLRFAGKEIVSNDGLHAMISVSSKPLILSPGFYPIEVEFFESTYGEGLEVSVYSPSDGQWKQIPKSMLYRLK
ncbi:MAG: glycoside hydrolase family 127 protein [Kiritimatiellae bacterium]|nr:glycoside hydrolase family 127 protein [Kiritimatiellia bacterium]